MIMKWATRVRQIRSLSLQEWQWLFASSVLLPAAGLSLRWAGLRSTMDWLERFLLARGSTPLPMQSASDAAAIARAVRIAATYGPYRATCLPRALVLWTLLLRRRLEGEFTIGVRKNQSGVEAHAWVMLNGVPLDQSPEAVWFVPLRAASSPGVRAMISS
jgi:hypothetical protein